MKVKEMYAMLAKRSGLTQKQVENFMNTFKEFVLECLLKGESVNLTRLCKFTTRIIGDRRFTNFRTGESFIAPAKIAPSVIFSKHFKTVLSGDAGNPVELVKIRNMK